MAFERTRVAEDVRCGHGQLEHKLGGEMPVRDAANSVGAEQSLPQRFRNIGRAGAIDNCLAGHGVDRFLAGHRVYRLEYCGALRAFFSPYFLRSMTRASRVR